MKNSMPVNVSVLGSTGSIGTQTLDVIRQNSNAFKVVALSGFRSAEKIVKQALEFKPAVVAMQDESAAKTVRELLPPQFKVVAGDEGICEAASLSEVKVVVNALSGFAGLKAVIAGLNAEKEIALANKECLVAAGHLVMERVAKTPGCLVPVDSEHNSIYQCLRVDRDMSSVRKIVLTASGGPFWKTDYTDFALVTPERALKHPRWSMGAKISIDSATMMNKSLELIEARWLFGVQPEQLGVLIHPQSVVHGLVEFKDGVVVAGLSETDMRVPIAFALSQLLHGVCDVGCSKRTVSHGVPFVDLIQKSPLEFYPPDLKKFPLLKLGFDMVQYTDSRPTVMNGANEVAVQAFLDKKIRFTDIFSLVLDVIHAHNPFGIGCVADVIEADDLARRAAQNWLSKH